MSETQAAFLTTAQVAAILGRRQAFVRELIAKGEIEVKRFGAKGRYLIPRAQFDLASTAASTGPDHRDKLSTKSVA